MGFPCLCSGRLECDFFASQLIPADDLITLHVVYKIYEIKMWNAGDLCWNLQTSKSSKTRSTTPRPAGGSHSLIPLLDSQTRLKEQRGKEVRERTKERDDRRRSGEKMVGQGNNSNNFTNPTQIMTANILLLHTIAIRTARRIDTLDLCHMPFRVNKTKPRTALINRIVYTA